ncbi:hypothetical protein DNU06_05050 [Putridiphycobacter roseus]|uniref:DUF6249 domain-containing protein n=1 Tax=Putridiphycobacter roseus TaxID=2219161 RepID=A0A2W1N0C8_9FLAO|nr:DUF6249 domain-containing protein [Putridiphycobacter roseus]PZE17989.1 hypothetical protein DNU06_05050 [Putridiphycobacter roseus]
MYQAVEIIIPLAAFAMIFGIVYLGVTSHHRKEMAMIEAGMNPDKKKEWSHSKIRTGLLFLLVPLGIFVGNLLAIYIDIMKSQTMGLVFGFLFGGIALVSAYFIERKLGINQEED